MFLQLLLLLLLQLRLVWRGPQGRVWLGWLGAPSALLSWR
jgi:hypothetical protein